jgi:hypothetical protein
MSVVVAEGCSEGQVDYRFVANGFIVAHFPKVMVKEVREVVLEPHALQNLMTHHGPTDNREARS